MTPTKGDSVVDLDEDQRSLEENASQLRRSQQQWRLWEAEYEALRDEIASSSGRENLARIRRDFDGQLVTRKETVELLGRTDLRPPDQIINQLDRRLDYVRRNIEALERRVDQTNASAMAAGGFAGQPDEPGDDALPVMDIMEQLDDEGNILSCRLLRPSDLQSQINEALGKAGVPLTPPAGRGPSAAAEGDAPSRTPQLPQTSSTAASSVPVPRQTAARSRPGISGDVVSPNSGVVADRKKVSFAEDTKPETEDPESENPPVSRSALQIQRRMERIMLAAQEQDVLASLPAVMPEGESPEDAALRREMLAYGASEIGPVVAELVIEEDEEGDSGDDDDGLASGYSDNDFSEQDDDENGDDDDENGRSRQSSMSTWYRKRMQQLEKKLSLPGTLSYGQGPVLDPADGGAGAGKDSGANNVAARTPKVAFAERLDTSNAADCKHETGRNSLPGSRTKHIPQGPDQAPARFLDRAPSVAPCGPEGQTIAESVVERPLASAPTAPTEFDAALLHRETAAEYHRVRNKMILKSGGFVKGDASALMPLDEEEGGPKRMSRFKAARLSRE